MYPKGSCPSPGKDRKEVQLTSNDLLVSCDCQTSEHQMVLLRFDDDLPDDAFIYVHFFLSDQPFWRRLLAGVRYIFGHKSKYGHFGEIMINPEMSVKLRDYINSYLGEISYRNEKEQNKSAIPEPEPKSGGKDILPLVIEDIEARSLAGKEKYGTFLQADNGRNALNDAYQEAIDLVMYLRQFLEEQIDDWQRSGNKRPKTD